MKFSNRFKYSIVGLAFFALVPTTFYFWASSANHSPEEYSVLLKNNFLLSTDTNSVHSILTYNLGYLSGLTNNLPMYRSKSLFDNNLKTVYKNLNQLDVDLICLQEIDYHSKRSFYVNQQDELQKLGYNYVFQAVNWDVNYLPFPYFPLSAHFGEIYSGQSILSKYPITEIKRVILSPLINAPFYRKTFYLERLAQVTKAIIDNQTVIIINVHLEAFDKETRAKQTKQIIDIYNSYKDDSPVLLVGDFNSDRDDANATIQSIFNISGIKSTNHLRQKSFPSDNPIKRLDYIFYNEQFIEILDSRVVYSFGNASDHLPVLMTFKFK